jgi:serine/threonine protein kinase
MQSDSQTPDSFTSGLGGAVRWADSALFSGLHTASEEEEWHPPPLTYKSDVYSLGSVILEVSSVLCSCISCAVSDPLQILSGRQPYHYIATDAQVVIELHKGNKPRRPTQSFVDDGQWELIQWCWTQPPEDRPDVHDVVDRVGDLIEERGARDSEEPVRKSR